MYIKNGQTLNPYDYQIEAINQMNTSKLLLMDVGAGKTMCSILAYKQHCYGNLLIICPAGMVKEWTEALSENVDMSKVFIYSYNKLCYDKHFKDLISRQYDCCVIDEAHHISNRKNKSSKKILKVIDTIRLKYLCTATPEAYKWVDMYIYFRIIIGPSYMSYTSYRSKYFIEKQSYYNPYVFDVIGYINETELFELKDKISIIYKKNTNSEKIEKHINLEINKDVKKSLNKIIRDRVYKNYIMDNPAKVSYMKRMMASGMILNNSENAYDYDIYSNEKLSKLLDLLETHKDSKILIYYNYLNERQILTQTLADNNINYNLFESKKDIEVFDGKESNISLISYNVGSEGINIFSDYNVYIAFSLPYSPRIWKQSKGRINRLVEHTKEYYYYMTCDVDSKILDVLKSGKNFTDKLMEKGEI